jgi:MFS transporter, DHA1 family, inner membrane transport protein
MIKGNRTKIFFYAFFQILLLFMARYLIAPLIPLISDELGVGLDFIGSAVSLSVFAIFFASLTAGTLIEIIGLKNVLFAGLLINLTGSVLLFFSDTFPIFIIAYFVIQLGLGMLVVCNLSIVGTFYPGSKASSLLKINLGGTAAFILAPLLVSFILFIDIDWRYYYIIHPVLIILLGIALWRIDFPGRVSVETNFKKLFSANKKIITNPAFALCMLIIFFYVSVTNTFFVWFTSYFESLGINLNISSLFLSIYGLAVFLGMIVRNQLIKYFKRKKILLFGFIASFLFLIAVIFTGNLIAKNIFIFLFGISIAGNFTITFSISSDIFPRYTNSASGFNVAFANLGIIVFQYFAGFMSEYYSKNSVLYMNVSILFILIIAAALLNFHRKFSRVP